MTTQHNKLDQDIIIYADSLFDQISYDNNANSWMFNFKNDISLFASTLWRLLKDDRIVKVSAATDNNLVYQNQLTLLMNFRKC